MIEATRWRELEAGLARLDLEEVEQRLEASPVLPGDPTADVCCGCSCEGDPVINVDIDIDARQ